MGPVRPKWILYSLTALLQIRIHEHSEAIRESDAANKVGTNRWHPLHPPRWLCKYLKLVDSLFQT